MIIYQINLPKKRSAKAFVKFMNAEYFPSVDRRERRVGAITTLTLLERKNEFAGDDVGREFFLHMGWSGVGPGEIRLDDDEVKRKFEAFKAEVKRLGSYEEVAF